MPGRSCKARSHRRPPFPLRTRRVPRSDRPGTVALGLAGRREPVAGRRRRHHTDFHGGARHHHRGRRAALHCRRSFGDGRRRGLAGGGLKPSGQGVLLDAFPVEKQGVAMTLFGLAALLAPVVGPTLGGWITDNYSWRWVFYINVPVGLIALAACYALLHDSDYLVKQRLELRKQPLRFDALGLSLLVIVMVSWEVMLSKGQEWDWLGDPFWRVQTLVVLFVVGLIAL